MLGVVKQAKTAGSASATHGGAYSSHRQATRSILHLHTIGNQSVPRMLQIYGEEPKAGSTAAASPRFRNDFSQITVHPPTTGAIRTKLAINEPGDEHEQEANRIADQVMRMPEPQRRRTCAGSGECPRCRKEQSERRPERLQTKHIQASDTGQIAAPPIVHEVLAAPGQALDPSTRAFMEPRFGHSFDEIRVHADTEAGESA